MNIIPTSLEGLLIIEPDVFGDRRGYFLETYHQRRYQSAGLDATFVQDNLSFSKKGTLRGLHFQITHPQAKLVQAITGKIFDVAVDIRPESPTFGNWSSAMLSEENKRQLFIPVGFAHGFCVTSETALFAYKCSAYYTPASEHTIRYDDPAIGIEWPVTDPLLSDKDRNASNLSEMDPAVLFA